MDSDVAGGIEKRRELMHTVGMNLPVLTSESDWMTRVFAEHADLSAHEFHALVFIAIAEMEHVAMTASSLRKQMGLSAPAITYLVQRLVEVDFLHRDADPGDRRKVILRQTEAGKLVVRDFFGRVAEHMQQATAELSDESLEGAHRTFEVMIRSLRGFRADLDARAVPRSRPSSQRAPR